MIFEIVDLFDSYQEHCSLHLCKLILHFYFQLTHSRDYY
uniref:Uncharacterized protein n=1 Tax=Schistosoma japonicum TaxID=6182 RepID=Q5BX33_SCHJA|nr:unknown [Schistosoma japonicum]